MIIDSKVSLTAYECYYATEDKSEKEKYLSQHIGSMKKHIHEPGLFNYAVEKNVAIISPVTLLATLRMIAAIWRQENQNKNVLDIAQQSGALYDKFVVFLGSLESIGKHLENGQKSYNEAFKQLKGGSGNIITKIEKIKKLGAKTSKSLKQEVIDEAKANDTQQLEMKEAMNSR